jgi:(S)-3,5-dihydroxyphenylglycine transaminase
MDLTLRSSLEDPLLEVMNFLNEVVLRYPGAISFAPGRPSERHFDVERSLDRAALWVESNARATGRSSREVWNDLGQYNRTNGIIHELIARQLAVDEGIDAAAETIVVTAGCQEAMAILLLGLIDPAADALLVSDPTYIGITHRNHRAGADHGAHPGPGSHRRARSRARGGSGRYRAGPAPGAAPTRAL